MQNIKILVIDDESAIRRLIKDFLSKEGIECIEAVDGKDGLEKFKDFEMSLSLIILDIMMPYIDGIEVLNEIRKTSSIPIIMLTAKSEDVSQISSFDSGANDYITKPFSPMILVSRVKNQLKQNSQNVINIGNITINDTQRKVFVNNEETPFTLKEYELLLLLIKNQNVAISRDFLIESIWAKHFDEGTRTLDTHIKQIRTKINESSVSIDTVRGYGYMLYTNLPHK